VEDPSLGKLTSALDAFLKQIQGCFYLYLFVVPNPDSKYLYLSVFGFHIPAALNNPNGTLGNAASTLNDFG
jgi:hypothetical protein